MKKYPTISQIFFPSGQDFERENVFLGRSMDMERAKAFPELSLWNKYLI
jgi:hypothetical protein